jgi:hypothetical protein
MRKNARPSVRKTHVRCAWIKSGGPVFNVLHSGAQPCRGRLVGLPHLLRNETRSALPSRQQQIFHKVSLIALIDGGA